MKDFSVKLKMCVFLLLFYLQSTDNYSFFYNKLGWNIIFRKEELIL